MTHWDGRLAVFDLETTGVDVDRARIVSACVAVLEGSGEVVARWDWLADPEVEIPEGAAAVHGITTEYARANGRSIRQVVAEIAQTLRVLAAQGTPLVVYNAPYDLSLLDRECRRHGVAPLERVGPVVDPLVLDKAVDRYRKGKRTLEVTAELYGVDLTDAHDAGSDAIAAGRVAQAIIARYPDELDVPPHDLHGRQELWYAEQAESFESYIREKKGDAAFVADREWPVRTPEFPSSLVDTQPLPRPVPASAPRQLEAAGSGRSAPFAPPAGGAEPLPETVVIETRSTVLEADLVLLEEAALAGRASSRAVPEAEAESAPAGGAEAATPPAPPAARPRREVLHIAAAIVTDPAGRALVVRKAGTGMFMQPGGKIEAGESAFEALVRELDEELGLAVDPALTEHLGTFHAAAANEPDTDVRAEVFALIAPPEVAPHGEIEELRWLDDADAEGLGAALAPLSAEHLMPLWRVRRERLF
ncbi:MAG: NUDIX domain-containing protein [Actinomycetales bacterium]|nr:NUDIX domain-containing protein [Actinomycetales bacterium]